MVIEKPL